MGFFKVRETLQALTDKVGLFADAYTASTLFAKVTTLIGLKQQEVSVYPTLANPVQLTGNAAAWTEGTKAQVVPASTITSAFVLKGVHVEAVSANDTFELAVYYGASDTECARIRVIDTAAKSVLGYYPIDSCPIIPANSVVKAAAASKGGGSDTIDIALAYGEY